MTKNNTNTTATKVNVSKASKQKLMTMLKDFISAVKKTKENLNLRDRINYTLEAYNKDTASVPKEELLALVNEVLAITSQPKPVETSKKPLKVSKKSEKTEETAEDEVDESEEEEPAKKSKASVKKSEKTNDMKTKAPATNVGVDNIPSAKVFPEEIDHKSLGKLIAVPNEYHDYEELVKAIDSGKTIYIAAYWTKRQIREFGYDAGYSVKSPKNGFPHDLDIAQAVLVCSTMDRLYAMSSYTEALYRFEAEDFNPLEDTDTNGDKFAVRVSMGMEFEIYVPADEVA